MKMVRPEKLCPDSSRSLVIRFSVLVVAPVVVDVSKTGERSGGKRCFKQLRLLINAEHPLLDLFGFGVITLVQIEISELDQFFSHIRMIRP